MFIVVAVMAPLTALAVSSWLYCFFRSLHVPFTDNSVLTSFAITSLLILSFCPIVYLVITRRYSSFSNIIIAVAFVGMLIAASLLTFAARCIDYGVYDAANSYADPRAKLFHKSARRVRIARSPGLCFYYSGITWVTVGYGDVIPSRQLRPFAVAEAILSYLIMAYLFALMMKLYDLGGDRLPGHTLETPAAVVPALPGQPAETEDGRP